MQVLYGSTATVYLEGLTARKVYHEGVRSSFKRMELENLEVLGTGLQGIVKVPSLLHVERHGEEITAITTRRVAGLTLSRLKERGLAHLGKEALKLAYLEAKRHGIILPDLATEGNLKVEVRQEVITRIWIVDVGDSF